MFTKKNAGIGATLSAIVLSLLMVFTPQNAAAADDNSWQVVSGAYAGNTVDYKTVTNDDVRIQKNVKPTDVENEFQVYMAVDAKCMETVTSTTITEILSPDDLNQLYTGGSANGFPTCYSGQEHTGNGALADNLKGSAKNCEPGDVTFKLIITYEKDGHTYTIAEPVLSLGVPNSVLYLKVGDDFICLENIQDNGGRITIGGRRPDQDADGNYIVPVHLTTMAYNALLNTYVDEETSTSSSSIIVGEDGSASITDQMGDYITYDGNASGNISNNPTKHSAPGGTVEWELDPKSISKPEDPSKITETIETTTETDPETGATTEVTVITRTWWAENLVEINYDAHLNVDKAGFVSGTDYPVNASTTLHYGENKTVEFENPVVDGTLYDFDFIKQDDAGALMPNVSFTLTGPSGNPDVASSARTVTSGSDGKVSVTGLPWGTYNLTETVPAGYTASAIEPLQIGYTSWPDGVTHQAAANDKYKFPNEGKVVNTQNKVIVNKSVDVFGDLTKEEIEHTIYYALWDSVAKEYLTDAEGNLVYKTVTITKGVPSPATVTFEGVPSGMYDVMELSSINPIAELEVNDVVHESDGTDIQIHGIAAMEGDGSSGNDADLTGGKTEAEVSFTNTYAHADVPVKFTANKQWATYSGTVIDAPENAKVTFTLYRTAGDTPDQLEEVISVELDGEVESELTVDEDTGIKYGELNAWEATFDNLPNQNENDKGKRIYLHCNSE